MSWCAHRNILTYLVESCLVLSMETRQSQPLAPPVADMEAVAEGPCEGPWLLVMPRGSLRFQASPGGLLVPVGCPVLFVCLALEGCLVLSVWPRRLFSCHVLSCLSSPGGLLIPPDYPRDFFFGGVERVLAVGAGPRPRTRRLSAMASWAPSSAMAARAPSSATASWAPSSAMASWAPCTAMASRAPSSAMVPICLFCSGGPRPAFLSVSVLRGLQSAHPPSPRGGSCQSCVSCVPASCFLNWFVSCPCLMSLWVNYVPAVFV